MPFYDYQCSQCGTVFTRHETFEVHDQQRNPKCPKCDSRKTRQLVRPVHVQTSKKS